MKQKPKDLFKVLFIYLLALGAAVLVLLYVPINNILWRTALADGLATIIVFLFSMRYNNSSIYCPYWSTVPIFIVLYWLINSGQTDFLHKIFWTMIVLWGVRLTWSWILRWDGMEDEDWRYRNIRNKTGKYYWLASFFGIHMLPSALVFIALIPVYYAIYSTTAPHHTWIAQIAFVYTLSAILLEKSADDELRRFIKTRKNNNEKIQTKLWIFFKYPNYLGEMAFWWGLYFMALTINPSLWWTFFGPLTITLLFTFVSIPMMRKHNKNKIYA